MNVEYRVLGPLEVLRDGAPVPVPAGRGRALLATLLLRPNQFVPVDELVDRVWDGEPPTVDRAHKTLQMVVTRLRKSLGAANRIRTVSGGYQVEIDQDELDLLRFRALAGSNDFAAASALWRGAVLVANHLVQTRSPGRYDMHDLLRAYAAELCGDDEVAALRLTEWYVHSLQNAADMQLAAQSFRAGEVTTGVVPQEFFSRFGALAWCRDEWDNLSAVMYAAIARGWSLLAQLIPVHLRRHGVVERVRARDGELVTMFEAVRDFGSPREQGLIKVKLAAAYVDVRRFDDALREFEIALPLVRATGERLAEASGLNNMSIAYLSTGRREESLACNRRSLELAVEIADSTIECVSSANIVGSLNDLRRYLEALEAGDQARAAIRRSGDEYLEARLDALVGSALAALGRFDEALTLFDRSMEGLRRFTDTRTQLSMLDEDIGPLLFRMGRHDEAVRAWEQALELARSTGSPQAEGLEAKLALVLGPGLE